MRELRVQNLLLMPIKKIRTKKQRNRTKIQRANKRIKIRINSKRKNNNDRPIKKIKNRNNCILSILQPKTIFIRTDLIKFFLHGRGDGIKVV